MKQIPISQVDVLFANGAYPIEFAFYYRNAFQTRRLRRALKKLSGPFWPLFGKYQGGLISSERYCEEDHYAEISVNEEFGPAVVEEKGHAAFSSFKLPQRKTLFFLGLIRSKGGLMVIPKMSHVAGDGYSYFFFLSLLARLSRPRALPLPSFIQTLPSKPHHRRTVLKEFLFRGAELSPASLNDTLTLETIEISRQEVKSLIREVASADSLRISGNDVLSALALKKLEEKQAASRGEDVDLTIPIDVRRYIKEYGRRFVGNGIWLHTFSLPRQNVAESGLKDLAVQIRKSMPHPSKETYLDYLAGLEKTLAQGKSDKLRPFDPGRGYLVTNLSNLPADKLDFGTGIPDRAIPLTAERNAAAILAKKENYVLLYGY